jgi:hypothetical protein
VQIQKTFSVAVGESRHVIGAEHLRQTVEKGAAASVGLKG